MVIEKSKKRTAAQSCTASVSNAVSHDDSEYTARKRSINDSSVYQKNVGASRGHCHGAASSNIIESTNPVDGPDNSTSEAVRSCTVETCPCKTCSKCVVFIFLKGVSSRNFVSNLFCRDRPDYARAPRREDLSVLCGKTSFFREFKFFGRQYNKFPLLCSMFDRNLL